MFGMKKKPSPIDRERAAQLNFAALEKRESAGENVVLARTLEELNLANLREYHNAKRRGKFGGAK